MIIDVTPQVRKANDVETICMDIYNQTERYVFMRGDVEFSVQFTPETLAEFCRKKTVSEMMESWYKGLVAEYERFQKAVDTRQHPVWTKTIDDPNYTGLGSGYRASGRYPKITVPYPLDDREVKNFQGYADRAKAKIKPITFWKIEK